MNCIFISTLLLLSGYHTAKAANYNQCGVFWNKDTPGSNGDFELRSRVKPTIHCDDPVAFEAATVDNVPYTETGELLTANLTYGLHCENRIQPDRKCLDYKIRWCCLLPKPVCPKGNMWTPYINTDSPTGNGDFEKVDTIRDLGYDICSFPSAIDVRETTTGYDYRRFRQNVGVSPTQGAWCVNDDNSNQCKDYKVRFCCPRTRE